MKIISGRFSFKPLADIRRAATLAGALLLVALAGLAGCKKSSPPVAETAPVQIQNTNAATAGATPGDQIPAPAPDQSLIKANGEPDLQALNRQYISYVFLNHHGFKTVEEFAAATNIKLPPLPPGKKFGFNGKGYIVVENR